MVRQTKKNKKATRVAKVQNPLFEKRPKNFRIGGDVQPTRDLTRFVRWPKYVLLQRQKRILMSRIKVPATINQFTKTLAGNLSNIVIPHANPINYYSSIANSLTNILKKYSPEDDKTKRARLVQEAQLKKDGKTVEKKKVPTLKFGLNHVTKLIEERKTKLVVIASNVDPIELVLWLPNLCRKFEVPFCFVRSKAALGKLVHKKTAAVVALTDVRKEDQTEVEGLTKIFRANYNDNAELNRLVGGNKLGFKSQQKQNAVLAAKEKESIKKIKN